MAYLNETYESQREIEEFVDDIIEEASEEILAVINEKQPSSGIQIPIRQLDLSKYPELSKYMDLMNGNILVYPLEPKVDADTKRNMGVFRPDTGDIIMKFPYYEIADTLNPDRILQGQIESFFYDKSLTGKAPRNILIHEIQHAFDYWRSGGKVLNTKSFQDFIDTKKVDRNFDTYLRFPHEISSRFSEAISELDYIDGGELIPLSYFLEDFKRKFDQWDRMTPKIQKTLMRRASGFWHKKQEELQNNESIMKDNKLLSLDDYIKLHEDFYNPFEDDENTAKQEPRHIADAGGFITPRKETFNLARVEWSKRPGGDYSVIAKTQFAKGEIIEICPMLILPEIAKNVDRLKDVLFEVDKKKGEYALVLGYGSLYGHSDKPNVDYAYNRRQRHMFFIANRPIKAFEELTIDYGKDYWEERSNLNLIARNPNISAVKDEEGETQPEGEKGEIEESGMVQPVTPLDADVQERRSKVLFAEPKSKANPAVSGVAIKGLGQQ